MQWNPILIRETRARWRSRGAFALVLGYAALLAFTMTLSYGRGLHAYGTDESWAGMARLGRQLFRTLAWLQTLGWMLIAPSLTATSIAGERERGLLEGLQLSPLTPWQVLSGKLLSALSFIVLVILASLPVTAICFLLGGVSPADFCLVALLQLVTAITCAIIGLWCSAWSRRASTAVRMSFGVVVMWGIGTAIAFGAAFVRALLPTTRAVAPGIKVLSAIGQTNPVIAALSFDPIGRSGRMLGTLATGITTSTTVIPIAPWQISIGFQCALSLLLLWSALRALRQPFAEQCWLELKKPKAKATATKPVTRDPGDSPWWELPGASGLRFANPILDREWRGKFKMRKAPLTAVIVEGLLALVVAFYYCRALQWALFKPESRQIIWGVLAMVGLIVIGLSCAVMGASAFTREREGETWQALTLSQLTPREIITGKFLAPLMACAAYSLPLWPLLLPCIRTMHNTQSIRGIAVTQAVASALIIGAMAWCYTAWGLFLSWRCTRMAAAIGWTLGTLFLLNVFLPIFLYITASVEVTAPAVRLWNPFFALLPILDAVDFPEYRTTVLQDALLTALTLFLIGTALLWSLYRSMAANVREKDTATPESGVKRLSELRVVDATE